MFSNGNCQQINCKTESHLCALTLLYVWVISTCGCIHWLCVTSTFPWARKSTSTETPSPLLLQLNKQKEISGINMTSSFFDLILNINKHGQINPAIMLWHEVGVCQSATVCIEWTYVAPDLPAECTRAAYQPQPIIQHTGNNWWQ